jgi:hypothetical protein
MSWHDKPFRYIECEGRTEVEQDNGKDDWDNLLAAFEERLGGKIVGVEVDCFTEDGHMVVYRVSYMRDGIKGKFMNGATVRAYR